MDIIKTAEGAKLNLAIEGRLDTNTAPKLEETVKGSLDGISELEFDFEKLDYISSAGLRVILSAQKEMNRRSGSMTVKNVSAEVMEIFEITGFVDFLTIIR